MSLGLILGIAGGGVALLLLVVGGIVAALVFGGSGNEVATTTTTTTPTTTTPTPTTTTPTTTTPTSGSPSSGPAPTDPGATSPTSPTAIQAETKKPDANPTAAFERKTEIEKLEHVEKLAVSADFRRLVAFRSLPSDRAKNIPRREVLSVCDLTNGSQVREISGEVSRNLAISPSGKFLLTRVGSETHVLDLETGEIVEQNKGGQSYHYPTQALSFDDSTMVLPGDTGYRVIRRATGKVVNIYSFKGKIVRAVAFSPTSARCVVGYLNRDSKQSDLGLYDTDTMKVVASARIPRGLQAFLRYSRDGNVVLAAGTKKFMLFKADDLTPLGELSRPDDGNEVVTLDMVEMNTDGDWIVSLPAYAGRPQAEVWQVSTKSFRKIETKWCRAAEFVADDRVILSDGEKPLTCYDLKTLKPIPLSGS